MTLEVTTPLVAFGFSVLVCFLLGKQFLLTSASSQISPERMSAALTKVRQIIAENPVAVFSKSYCPYCKATRATLSGMNAKIFLVELDQVEDGSELQDVLAQETGQRTVPNVFIDHKHVGGNSDVQAMKSKLPGMLKDAGAL